MDPINQFKEQQKIAWSNFANFESLTATVAPVLLRFAGVKAGTAVLDVACGTGVAALTAARLGANVTGLDLTPELIARARENSALMNLPVAWHEGDAEKLPLPDAHFDFVVSQFGHMFAPRPEVVIGEMLRVLKPGGVIAFVTWPTELLTGRMYALLRGYAPPPPSGVSPPAQWGDPAIIRERLGAAVKDIFFARDAMLVPSLSPQHYRQFTEQNLGPMTRLLQSLDKSDPAKAATLRHEFEELAAHYFENNIVRLDYLLTRAIKA
ncbi:MAG: class I SAM-dependent methyltransferase [Alphaproteobacteria bacterium]|nr:class I SAM-dependent methyltransferase [Alphaproteobacteria bacterium]